MEEGGGGGEDKPGFWSTVKQAYEGLVHTVIRPPRAVYSVEDLGSNEYVINSTTFQRVDITLVNDGGYKIECSWWKPVMPATTGKMPCIVALHGNSSCRIGCLDMAYYALTSGFTLFALDFCGSGISEGKYVSLGFHESNDIQVVTQYLSESKEVSHVVLWGRSMGSVAALMYAARDEAKTKIHALVLDSPFASLPQLANELVDGGQLNVPKVAVSVVMRMVRGSIKKRAKFDMFKLKPVSIIHSISIPAFFAIALQDELIPPHHGETLHKQHGGPKKLFRFSGGHNSPRPHEFYTSAIQFIRVMIGLPPNMPTNVSNNEAAFNNVNSTLPSVKVKSMQPMYRNPLENETSIESVPSMSIKELKAAIYRAGFKDTSCVEKQDLIDLVMHLYQKHLEVVEHDSVDSMASAPVAGAAAAAAVATAEQGFSPRGVSPRDISMQELGKMKMTLSNVSEDGEFHDANTH